MVVAQDNKLRSDPSLELSIQLQSLSLCLNTGLGSSPKGLKHAPNICFV